MFTADFFRNDLPKHITEKSKHSREGVVTVELHIQFGGRYVLASILESADAALVIEAYPETGSPSKNPEEERALGAPQFDLDRIALAYSSISHVVITTRRARKEIGFRTTAA
jgi:hypothetical protein